MTRLEKKKLESELAAVTSARLNLEYRIEEKLEDIARLQEHVKIQIAKEHEITNQLKEK